MFKARTYILKPGILIKCKKDLKENYTNYFIDLNNKKEIEEIKEKVDIDYIDGYVYLEYDGNVILNYELWDLVDQLWAYFLNLIEDFLENNAYAESGFPDQPIDIKMTKHLNGYVVFCITSSIGKQCYAFPKKEFFSFIIDYSEKFFCKLKNIFPEYKCSHELQQIKILREKIKEIAE